MKRFIVALICIAMTLGAWGAWEGYKRYSAVFPTLSAGVYHGAIHINGRSTIPFLVLQRKDDTFVSVAVASKDFAVQRVRCTDPSGMTRLPLIFEGANERFRLTGRGGESPEQFSGKAYEALTGVTGSWWLERATVAPVPVALKQDLVQWSSLKDELHDLGEMLDDVQGVLNQQVSQEAQERQEVTESLPGIVDASNTGHAVGLQAFEALKGANRYGRLVKLGRESLIRDSSWITSVLASIEYETSEDFQEAWMRAQRVLELKDAIEHARSKAQDEGRLAESGQSEIERENEFYQQFQ